MMLNPRYDRVTGPDDFTALAEGSGVYARDLGKGRPDWQKANDQDCRGDGPRAGTGDTHRLKAKPHNYEHKGDGTMEMKPTELIDDLIRGAWSAQCVYVAAKLGIADLLADGPRPLAELADRAAVHPHSLYRVLRALSSLGVFAEEPGRRFRLTPAAECLRADVPCSKRALTILFGEEYYRAWGEILYSVRTGKASVRLDLWGAPVRLARATTPKQAANFDKAMVGAHGGEAGTLGDAYNFSDISSIADIGGGNGSTLCAILRHGHNLRGTLYDLPDVIDRARGAVESAGLSDRIHLVKGDFSNPSPRR